MFEGCNHLETIYAGNNWSTDSVTSSANMFLDCFNLVGEQGTVYDENHVDAAYAHIDGGPANPGYLSRKREAYASLSTNHTTLTFYNDDQRLDRSNATYLLNTGLTDPGWSEYAGSVTQVAFDSTFVAARPTSTNSWFRGMNKLKSIAGLNYLNTSSVKDMRRMFANCDSLRSLDLSSFNTDSVTNMWAMFVGCKKLTTIDLSSFNTSNVTNMARMFSGCDTLTSIKLGSFKTDRVKDMAGMFAGCRYLTSLDLSSFKTDSVRYMGWMFDGCDSLRSLDMSGFNTLSVTEMEYMFQGCKSLASIELSGFNTMRVKDMAGMFAGCETLSNLDLNGFNTSNVTSMESMFNGCKHLETIYAGYGWRTGAVSESDNMFYGCTSLVGGQGTVYDEHYVDVTRAHIDGGSSNPGYLTGKYDTLRGDVNADGEVNIADVNCIIGIILGGPDIYGGLADVNVDGEVNIADINAVIGIIL